MRPQPGPPRSQSVNLLRTTPLQAMVDARGRPYFLWDCDMTLAELQAALASGDRSERLALLAKVLRQARPEDALQFVSRAELTRLEPELRPLLGDKADFWQFWCDVWRAHTDAGRHAG